MNKLLLPTYSYFMFMIKRKPLKKSFWMHLPYKFFLWDSLKLLKTNHYSYVAEHITHLSCLFLRSCLEYIPSFVLFSFKFYIFRNSSWKMHHGPTKLVCGFSVAYRNLLVSFFIFPFASNFWYLTASSSVWFFPL